MTRLEEIRKRAESLNLASTSELFGAVTDVFALLDEVERLKTYAEALAEALKQSIDRAEMQDWTGDDEVWVKHNADKKALTRWQEFKKERGDSHE